MVRNVTLKNGHYQLPLLWRNDAKRLPDSRMRALQSLKGLKRRLENNEDL